MKFLKKKKNKREKKLTSLMKLSLLIDRCFFSALLVVFFAIIALLTYLYIQAENNAYIKLITNVKRSNISLSTFIDSYFEDIFHVQDKLLKDFSYIFEKKQLSKAEKKNMDYLLSILGKKHVRKIIFLSTDGKVIYSAPQKQKTKISINYKEAIKHLNQQRQHYISKPINVTNSENQVIIVASSYFNKFSEFSGVVCFILDSNVFYKNICKFLKEHERMWIFNVNKEILFQNFEMPEFEKVKNYQEIDNFMSRAINNDNGILTYKYIFPDGHKEDILVSFSPISITKCCKWVLCTESFTQSIPEKISGFPVFYSKPLILFCILLFCLLLINRYFIRRYIAILECAVDTTNQEKNNIETSLTSILNAFPYILFETDTKGVFTFVSAPCYEISGIRAEDMIGSSLYKFTVLPKNELNFIYDQLLNKKDSVNHLRLEMKFRNNELKYMSFNAVPVIGDGGKVIVIKGVLHDVTERVKLESELVQAKKQDTMGMIISGIAHDFNNYLTSIIGYISLLKMYGYNESILNKLEKSASNAGKLTTQLLAFSRTKKMASETVCNDLNDVLIKVLDILKIALPKSIELDVEIEENLPPVKASSYHIEQIIMNLIMNARDAMPKGGNIKVTVWKSKLSKRYASPLNLQMGHYIIIKVADTGIGLDEEMQKRIFEPYFTTKQNGTGVGLASARILVKNFGGNILVKSKLGKGSEFAIYIPVWEDEKN